MVVSAFVLVSLFCQGHTSSVPTPDIRDYGGGYLPPLPKVPECPTSGLHHFPDSARCDGYYECTEGLGSYQVCPEGLMYNPDASPDSYPCDDATNLTCTGPALTLFKLPSPPPECQGEEQQHLPDPDRCNAFYECRGGVAIQQECPEELVYNAFSPATRFPCDYPTNVVCGASPSPPLPPPSGHPPPQRPQHPEPESKKVFNFYEYVTNNW